MWTLSLAIGNQSHPAPCIHLQLTHSHPSIYTDCTVYLTTGSVLALLFLATSPAMFTFLLRPFSNSLETLLFAFALACIGSMARQPGLIKPVWMVMIGIAVGVGLWTRVTFVAFVAPVGVANIVLAAVKARQANFKGFWSATSRRICSDLSTNLPCPRFAGWCSA